MSLFNRFAEMTGYAPRGSVFQNWVQQLAPYFNADVHWDEDGDTAAVLNAAVGGVQYPVCIVLNSGILYVRISSNITFPPDRLPREVAEYLAERNSKLPYFDWDATSNSRCSYFFAKSHGAMNRLSVGTVRDVIEKMLPEVIALDAVLRNEGYVR